MATTVSAMMSPATPNKRYIPPSRILLALTSGAVEEVITFSPSFDNIPASPLIVTPLGVNGTFQVKSGTLAATGFTLEVTGCSDIGTANVEVVIAAHEKL